MRFFGLAAAVLVVGCGMSDEEHSRLMKGALDLQKARYDVEMKKMREGLESERAAVVKEKEGEIGRLEDNLIRLTKTLREVRRDMDQIERERHEAERVAKTFKEKLQAMVDSGKLEVVMRKGRMTVKLPDNVLFPKGSRRLKSAGKEALISVAEVMREVEGRSFLIAGHTDNVPTSGGYFKSNWELSSARALTVVHLMIEAGVPSERIAAAGYGEFDPVGDNETEEGRELNRRLEIILMPNLQDAGF